MESMKMETCHMAEHYRETKRNTIEGATSINTSDTGMIGLICKEKSRAVLRKYFNIQSVTSCVTTLCSMFNFNSNTRLARHVAEVDRAGVARTITALH